MGEHFVLGFDGAWPSDEFLSFLAEESIAGVILFASNLENQEQIVEMIRCLQEARPSPMIVSVDHEGGRVFRMSRPFTAIPPARVFGDYYERTGETQEIITAAELIAAELLSVGFNLNYAPVLDIDTCVQNPIIGDRAFHHEAETVAVVGEAFIQGFANMGLLSCGKHFPGHGDTREDSHKTLPQLALSREQLEAREFIPFVRAIQAGVPSLMTAHVLYQQVDRNHCGTLSRQINHSILRENLGFDGVLFSDDLLMQGILGDHSVPEAAEQALRADCDAVLICRDFEAQQQAIEDLKRRVTEDTLLEERLNEAAQRMRKMMARLSQIPTLPPDTLEKSPLAGQLAKIADKA